MEKIMRKLATLLAGIAFLACANAQNPKTITLEEPNTERGLVTMKAFQQRQSTREFADKELSTQDLSDLLWAANGFNRDDKRTAGTAMNMQEIDVYVCMKDGAYLYDAKAHMLVQVTKEDLRPALAMQQDYVKTAPVALLIVADMSRAREDNEHSRAYTAYDAGIVSQNISLFCAGCNMATVCRGYMDKDAVHAALSLTDKHVVHLNHPVGYFK